MQDRLKFCMLYINLENFFVIYLRTTNEKWQHEKQQMKEKIHELK